MAIKIMAYDKKKILKDSFELIEKHHLVFMSDVIGLLPVSEKTFYTLFNSESQELQDLKNILDKNRISMKSNMRKKWYQSENATLQVALMKLIANDDEAARLSGTPREQKQEKDSLVIKWNDLNAG
jgi:hypothetical protein